MSLRNKILLAEDRPRHSVALPEWGVEGLFVDTLSAADRDDYETWAFGDDRSNYRAKLVCRALVDGSGQRVFADDDAAAVGHKSAAVVARIFDLACAVNGLLKGDVEDLEKLATSRIRRLGCRLALAWGVRDPDQLLQEMTSEQIGVWLAFDAVEPIGRAWERSGLLASLEMATAGQKFDADYFAPRPIAPQPTTAE